MDASTPALIVSLVGLTGLGTVVSVATSSWFQRRQAKAAVSKTDAETGRTEAETLEIIERAAGGQVARLDEEIARATGKIAALETRVEELIAERNERRRMDHRVREGLVVHRAWDVEVASALRHVGQDVRDPPPLLPDER